MDYVDWVDRVLGAVATAWRQASPRDKYSGVDLEAIATMLELHTENGHRLEGTKAGEAILDALRDLESLGLVDRRAGYYYALTAEGNKYPIATLQSAWGQIVGIYLDDDQIRFMRVVAEICQETDSNWVCVRRLTGREVFESLGWPWDDDGLLTCHRLVNQLSDMGLVTGDIRMGDFVQFVPTYVGIVRLTREDEAEANKLLRQLLDDWETTNVDFKRELNLRSDKEKAEFIRDALGLATTKSSGRRFLVIGSPMRRGSSMRPSTLVSHKKGSNRF